MDIVFSNRISANIFKECAQVIVENRQYTETPIELRKRVEDCLDSYFEQHEMVMRGLDKAPKMVEPKP